MATELELWKRMGKDILTSPNNDDLRLEFAALLQERETDRETAGDHSQERAQLIRVQLALASTTPDGSEWMRLATEAESLLLDHEKEWTPSWYEDAEIRDAEFHRGFIECITVSMSNLVEYRHRIFTESPVRHLDIVDLDDPEFLEDSILKLEADGFLDRMISLRLDGQQLEDQHVKLLNRSSLSSLRWLSLAHNNIGYEGALALTNEHLEGLAFVALHGNPFDPVERLSFDQGIVIDRSMSHVMRPFPDVAWRRHRVISGLVFYPNRFESVRGFTEDNPDDGAGEGPSGLNRQDGGARRRTVAYEEEVETA